MKLTRKNALLAYLFAWQAYKDAYADTNVSVDAHLECWKASSCILNVIEADLGNVFACECIIAAGEENPQ